MTDRIPLDSMTSDDLDQLYAETDRLTAELADYDQRVQQLDAELAALRSVARGYCPACGRGDAAPTVEHWEQQRDRADRAEAALARIQALANEYPAGIDTALILEALDQTQAPANPPGSTVEQLPSHVLALLPTHPYLSTACQTADAVAITAVRGLPLYDELRAHAERLHARCRLNHKFTGQLCTCGCHPEPAPVPAATQATDTPKSWDQPVHDRPCTATIEGRDVPGGRRVQCTQEARHPGNHVGPKQGSNGRVLWEDHNTGATPHRPSAVQS